MSDPNLVAVGPKVGRSGGLVRRGRRNEPKRSVVEPKPFVLVLLLFDRLLRAHRPGRLVRLGGSWEHEVGVHNPQVPLVGNSLPNPLRAPLVFDDIVLYTGLKDHRLSLPCQAIQGRIFFLGTKRYVSPRPLVFSPNQVRRHEVAIIGIFALQLVEQVLRFANMKMACSISLKNPLLILHRVSIVYEDLGVRAPQYEDAIATAKWYIGPLEPGLHAESQKKHADAFCIRMCAEGCFLVHPRCAPPRAQGPGRNGAASRLELG